jgi:hypothetical protein
MHQIIESTDDKGGIYLGGIDAALDVKILLKRRIGAILTVAYGANYGVYPESFVSSYSLIIGQTLYTS